MPKARMTKDTFTEVKDLRTFLDLFPLSFLGDWVEKVKLVCKTPWASLTWARQFHDPAEYA
jgi:hypothetical protein